MIAQLSNWKGRVSVNGVDYNSVADISVSDIADGVSIVLIPKQAVKKVANKVEHIITVKKYMTMPSNDGFDFMKQFNNNIPMPLRTMVGTVEKETKGMVYMNLHGDIVSHRMCTCMKCGRPLTNAVSQYFGIGPECGGHNYTNPFSSDEELKEAIKYYRENVLTKMTWSGWIIRSSLLEDRLVNE